MAAKLIAFGEGDERVVVEVDEELAGPQPVGRAGEITEEVSESFESIVKGVRPIADAILDQLKGLGPEQLTVEFGIKLTGEAGLVLAKASTEGHCKITLAWKPGGAA